METNIIEMNSGLGSDFRQTNMLQSFLYMYLFGENVFKSFKAILTFTEMHKETKFCVTTNILIKFSRNRVKFSSLLMCAWIDQRSFQEVPCGELSKRSCNSCCNMIRKEEYEEAQTSWTSKAETEATGRVFLWV
jgi:hypothetical protein